MEKRNIKRIAAIDLGTQTFRMIIAEAGSGALEILAHLRENVRLGQGLRLTGRIQPESMERGIAALKIFRRAVADYGVRHVRVCGTQALRLADNSQEFLEQVENLGFHVQVLTGRDEAAISMEGVKATLPHLKYPVAVMDIGGGSSEFILAQRDGMRYIQSFNIGAVTLTEQFITSYPPDDKELKSLVSRVELRFAPLRSEISPLPEEVVAVGGTATTLAAIHLGMTRYDPLRVRGLIFTLKQLRDLWDRLSTMGRGELSKIKGLEPERADIILAGTALVIGAMQSLNAESITISDGGLLLGLLTIMKRSYCQC